MGTSCPILVTMNNITVNILGRINPYTLLLFYARESLEWNH